MAIFDCHVHTTCSFDGRSSLSEVLERAKTIGLSGVAITDHTRPVPEGTRHAESVRQSVENVNRLKDKENDVLLMSGFELSDPFDPGYDYEAFYQIDGVDCILGSVHSTPIFARFFPNLPSESHNLKMSAQTESMDLLRRFTERYYTELLDVAERADVDVIAHLTFPFRYINGVANRGLLVSEFDAMIDAVLKAIIKTQKSLEINSAGFSTGWNEFLPNRDVLKRYYAFGGRFVTTGSDAHESNHLANGIHEAHKMLKEIGFTHASYYINRKRHEYLLESV